MNKLAVFFPGIGYTVDKPLMHYSRRMAAALDHEIRLLPYTGFPQKVKGDRSRMEKSYELAYSQSVDMLSDLDLSHYDEILFVGKSVGTIVAAQLASESPVRNRIRLVLYTPLEETFLFSTGPSVVFTGSADPWVQPGRIPELCREKEIPCHIIPDANHSLECGDIQQDLKNMQLIMQETERFILQETGHFTR